MGTAILFPQTAKVPAADRSVTRACLFSVPMCGTGKHNLDSFDVQQWKNNLPSVSALTILCYFVHWNKNEGERKGRGEREERRGGEGRGDEGRGGERRGDTYSLEQPAAFFLVDHFQLTHVLTTTPQPISSLSLKIALCHHGQNS